MSFVSSPDVADQARLFAVACIRLVRLSPYHSIDIRWTFDDVIWSSWVAINEKGYPFDWRSYKM